MKCTEMHFSQKGRIPKFSNIVLEELALPSMRGNGRLLKYFSEKGGAISWGLKEKRNGIWNQFPSSLLDQATACYTHDATPTGLLVSPVIRIKRDKIEVAPSATFHQQSQTYPPPKPEHTICTSVCFPEQVLLWNLLTRQVGFVLKWLVPTKLPVLCKQPFPTGQHIYSVAIEREWWMYSRSFTKMKWALITHMPHYYSGF